MKPREAHHSVKHHLIALPVLDLVVEVLRQVQTPVDVLLEPDGALQGERQSVSHSLRHVKPCKATAAARRRHRDQHVASLFTLAFHMSQNLKMSTCRPHWMALSPVS